MLDTSEVWTYRTYTLYFRCFKEMVNVFKNILYLDTSPTNQIFPSGINLGSVSGYFSRIITTTK